MIARPILFSWDGESMTPAGDYWAKRADEQFVIGERYRLEVIEERSAASHGHYFAALAEAQMNLPHDLQLQFPTVERLRKHALIKTGWADENTFVFSSENEASRFASYIMRREEYAIVVVAEATVKIFTAKSQSKRSMKNPDFQASKDAVLGFVAGLVGVTTKELKQNAGRAA